MLRVAIVDDDGAIRAELKRMLATLNGKCVIALEAEDGDEADGSPLLPELDLILTDINMRRMDGIQLIQSVKKRWPEIEIVVLSNYDDFSLVRDAMKYGASDYLLKYQLTQEALDSLVEVCLQKKQAKQKGENVPDKQMQVLIASHLLRDFSNRRLALPELLHHLDMMELPIQHMNAALFLVYTQEAPDAFSKMAPGLREHLGYQSHCYYWEHHPGCLAVAVFRHQTSAQLAVSENYLFAAELFQQFLPEYRDAAVICRSETMLRLCDLPQDLESLLECGCNVFYLGAGVVLDRSYLRQFTQLDREFARKSHQSLLEAVKRHDIAGFQAAGSRILESLRQDKCHPEQAKEFLTGVFRDVCFWESAPQEDGFFNKAEKKLRDHLCTLDDVRLLFETFGALMARQADEGEHKTIRQALLLIEREYGREITLDQAAQACGYNKNYFCRLFKETYGCSFGEYLTRYRMEKAQQMLKEEFVPVNQVARQVGMEYHHFCRTFKRFYHSTPSSCKPKPYEQERKQ